MIDDSIVHNLRNFLISNSQGYGEILKANWMFRVCLIYIKINHL